MKFNTQGLALVIVFQLFIVGATLYITETNAGAVGLPCAKPDTGYNMPVIGIRTTSTGIVSSNYLTEGVMPCSPSNSRV